MKKYELTSETKEIYGTTLYRIRALMDFGDVKFGDLGGWIEKESNLGQTGNAMVSGNANISNTNQYRVFGPAGSRDDFTTFFMGYDEIIYAKCGCFFGTVDDFCKQAGKDPAYSVYQIYGGKINGT